MLNRRELMAGIAGLAGQIATRTGHAAGSQQVLFSQPSFTDGIDPHFSVTAAKPAYNPVGEFYLHANQPNPFDPSNDFVPVRWAVSSKTGLTVPYDRINWQRGIWVPSQHSARGHTAAQVTGESVGAYVNSADLINGSPGNRMMIAPGYEWANPPVTFGGRQSLVGVSLDLQVPTASNGNDRNNPNASNSFAKIDLLFVCRTTGARLSYSCGLFVNGGNPKHDSTGFDDLAKTVIIAAQVSSVGTLVTPRSFSALLQSYPWTGWKTFSFTISQAQFAAGLVAASPVAESYGYRLALDPADYTLATTHLNAEIHYTQELPASIGWSMRRLTITQLA